MPAPERPINLNDYPGEASTRGGALARPINNQDFWVQQRRLREEGVHNGRVYRIWDYADKSSLYEWGERVPVATPDTGTPPPVPRNGWANPAQQAAYLPQDPRLRATYENLQRVLNAGLYDEDQLSPFQPPDTPERNRISVAEHFRQTVVSDHTRFNSEVNRQVARTAEFRQTARELQDMEWERARQQNRAEAARRWYAENEAARMRIPGPPPEATPQRSPSGRGAIPADVPEGVIYRPPNQWLGGGPGGGRTASATPGGRATSGGGGNTSHGRGNVRAAGTPPSINAAPRTTTATVVAGGTAIRPSGVRPAAPFASLPPVQAANRLLGMIPPVVQRRILPALGVVGTVAGTGGDVLRGRGPLGIAGNNVGGWGGGILGALGGGFVAGPIGRVLGGVAGGGLGGALLGTLGDALDGLFGTKPVRDALPLFPAKPNGKTAGSPVPKDFDEPDIDYIDDFPNPGRGFGIRFKTVNGSTVPNPGQVSYSSWFTVKSYSIRRNEEMDIRIVWGTTCSGVEEPLQNLDFYRELDYSLSIEISSARTCPGEPETITQAGTEPGRRRQGNGATPTGPRSFPPATPQTGPGQFPNFSPPTQPADRFGSPRGGEGNAPSSPQQVPGVNPIKPGSGDGSPAPAPPATNPAPPDARAPVADPQNRPKNPAPDNLDNPNGNPGRSPAATPAKKDAPGAGIQFDAMGLPVGRAGSGVYARANGGNVIEPKQSGFTNFGNGVRIPNEMLDSPEARKYYQDLAKALGTPGATLPDMPQKLRDKLNAPSSSTSTSTRPTAKPGETVTSDRPLVLPIPAPTKYTSTDRRPIQDRETSPFDAPDNANPSPAGSPCTGRCSAGIDAGVRQANQKLDRLASGGGGVNAGLNTTQVQQLNNLQAGMDDVLKRLGPQITGKGGKAIGIAGRLGSMWQMQFLGQVWNFLGVFFTIHNAAMLSRNLVSSVTDLLEQGVEAALRVLRLKDAEEDPPIDVAELITQGFQGLMTQIFGTEAWTQMQARWINLNRIIASAAAMYQNVQSMFDGARSLIELTANNVSRIGNAMKNSRVVNQNAYPWMPTGLNSMTGRTARLFDTLNNASELADLGTTMAGEIINIDDEARELADNVGRFKEQVRQGQELAGGDGKITSIGAYPPEVNKPNEALEESKRRVSEGSDVTAIDMLRGDVPWEFIGDKPKDD